MAVSFASTLLNSPFWQARRARVRSVARADAGLLARGNGVLGGNAPAGLTTKDGAPVSATVRVLVRDPANPTIDGVQVRRVQSAADGTWRVRGLNRDMRYDVIGRLNGYNDVIQADVQPEVI